MEISIQKGTTVSLHEQLVTQIALQIAAGLLKPGAKLPSIRALSQKLDIHHNTCLNAYKELEKSGLIHIRHGSGIRVAATEESRAHPLAPLRSEPAALALTLEPLADFFVRQVTQGGYAWEDVLVALEHARQQPREPIQQSLVVVDIHADILPVFQAELQQALNRPVQKALLSQLDFEAERNSYFVVSRYHYQSLKNQLHAHWGDALSEQQIAERIRVIDVGAVQQELELVKQLPDASLITVVSGSTIILQQAEAVIKALRGEGVSIRTVVPGYESPAELQRVLKRSQVIFADWLCVPPLQALTRTPIHTIRTIPKHVLPTLQGFC